MGWRAILKLMAAQTLFINLKILQKYYGGYSMSRGFHWDESGNCVEYDYFTQNAGALGTGVTGNIPSLSALGYRGNRSIPSLAALGYSPRDHKPSDYKPRDYKPRDHKPPIVFERILLAVIN